MKGKFYCLLILTIALCGVYLVYTTIDFSNTGKIYKIDINQCDARLLRKQFAQQLINVKRQLDQAISKNQPPDLNTLNTLDTLLEQVDPIYTIPLNKTAEPGICPEIFTDEDKWIRPCKQTIDSLLTILLFPAPSQICKEKCSTFVSRTLSNLHRFYPKVRVIIANRHPECRVQNTNHKNLREMGFGTRTTDAVVLNALISTYITTPYTFIARDLNNLNQFARFERQISVFGLDPRIQAVGSATRNASGHWKVGCYQSEMKNYVLEYTEGYRSSKNECMFCDYISSPFMAKTDFLQKMTFDENLHDKVIFEDFFIRVRNSGSFVLNCPDVMHFSSPSRSLVRDHWVPMAFKWQLNYVLIPPETKLKFSCSEIGLSCVLSDKLTKTHFMPRCCIDAYVDALRFIQKMAEKYGFVLEIDCGTAMGAVKTRGVLPWDVDGDLVYLSSQHNLIAGLASEFKENGFRLQIRDDARFSTTDLKWDGGYMLLWTPEQSIELYGQSFGSAGLLPFELRNVSTKAEMNGAWLYAPANPGLFIRNRYATECLQHAHHWRQTGKTSSYHLYEAGIFNSCPRHGHHACADLFPPDGNLQFTLL